MAASGEELYRQLLSVLESSDRPDTHTQKQVSDFISSFDATYPDCVLYYLQAALTASRLHVRQMAALCLKKVINVKWPSLSPEVKLRLKEGLIQGIQIDDSDVRKTFGSAFVSLFAVEGYENWPEAPGLLLKMVTESPNVVIRETAGCTLLMLVEDMVYKEQCDEEDQLHGVLVSERLSNFVAKDLLPRVLEMAATVPGSLVFACKMLSTLMESGIGSLALFDEYFFAFWNLLGSIANNRDPAVRSCVLKGMLKTWDCHPTAILDAAPAVLSFIMDCTDDKSDVTVQMEALKFWSHILKNRMEESIRLRLMESLRQQLPRLIPILIENTKYTEWDYMSMDESHLEEDNANIPDRPEDVPPRPEGDMGSEDDECATWGTNWTVRKGAALALDYISQVFGQDQEILVFLLDNIQRRLGDTENWEVNESAVLVLGAIARGCAYGMTPYLPKVIQYLIELTRHRKPLLRSIACWCLSRFADWIYHEQNEKEYMLPVLNAVLARVLDSNKRVQEAACSSLASFIEDSGARLIKHIGLIVEVLVKAFRLYQARNVMILYDAVGTSAQMFGEALPSSPYGVYLIQPLLHNLNTTETHSPQFLGLMECLSSIVQCWDIMYVEYAEATIKRAMNAVFEVLNDAKAYELTEGTLDAPRWDIVDCSMDVISCIVSVGQEKIVDIVSRIVIVLDVSAAKDLKLNRQQVGMTDMLTLCCQCNVPSVLQSTFALIGDLSWYCSDLITTDPIIKCLCYHLVSPIRPVCNNVCWALGVLTQSPQARQQLEPYFNDLIMTMIQLLKRESDFILLQNIAITIGRFAYAYPDLIAPKLMDFLYPWLQCLSRVRNDKEKDMALCGISNAVMKRPDLPGDAILGVTRTLLAFPPVSRQVEGCLNLMAQRLLQHPEHWRSLGEEAQNALKARLSGIQ
ncbi:armadillo-like helical protein [Babesia gibsoni]|uniref:Armadillo-like helical protein n=1 Tax=Babesia gibsoni TaxID=33632 RepID=A0AAD8PDH2_BABGI|nr:armadillo-like helical protein [Babesia gibsoni]